MTITRTQVSSISYEGNGATSFSFPFKVQQNTEIKVDFYDSNNSVQTLTLDTDYTVSNWDIEGQGMISLTNALQTGTKITIQPNVNFTQLVDLKNSQTLSPETVENTLDKLTLLTRQNNELLSRALTFRNNLSDKNVEITEPLVAGYGFEVNSTGDGIKLTELPIANIISTATTLKNTTETYKDSALSSLNSIQKLSLGSKSSAPTVDNNGNALVAGTLYYDTTATLAKIYNGTAWQDVAGLVTSASNLTTGTLPIARLADGSIITVKLADDSVTTAKIADNAVTTAIIADNSVDASKLNVSGNGTAGQVLKTDGDGSFTWGTGSTLPTHIIATVSGIFFVRNTDGSLPNNITSANVWSLTDQSTALGGTAPSGKNHIELPVGKVIFKIAGAGGGGGAIGTGSDGGDTTLFGCTSKGGIYGQRAGYNSIGRALAVGTIASGLSGIVKLSGGGEGGQGGGADSSYGGLGGDGLSGNLLIVVKEMTAGDTESFTLGIGGTGSIIGSGGDSNARASSGKNGFIEAEYIN